MDDQPLSGAAAIETPSNSPVQSRAGGAFWVPVLAAVVLLLVIVGGVEYWATVLNGGRLTYSLDDTYLHLALAKNLVRHGVWGFSVLDGFNSSDSSLLYPLLLAACVAVFGDREFMPLLLNVLASSAALFYVAVVLRRFAITGWRSFVTLVAIIVFVPLPAMISTGMEHSVQILLTLAFVDLAARLLMNASRPAGGTTAQSAGLLVLGGLLTSIRYEGLFLVGIVGLLLLCRRRWLLAGLLGIAAALPLVAFGWYSVRQGWYPVPNSILLKGNTTAVLTPAGVLAYLGHGPRVLLTRPHLLIVSCWILAALIMEWRRQRTLWTYEMLLLVITLAAIALHVQFADAGWFYRYEAYLMVLAFLALGIWVFRRQAPAEAVARGWAPPPPRLARALAIVLGLASCLLLGVRTARALEKVPVACHNIFEQQYQMGLFLRQFYTDQGVAANDVGAIDYLADIRLFDTFGLANLDVLRARRANRYDHAVVEQLLNRYHVRVVMVYREWAPIYGGVLPAWVQVGQWSLTDAVICAPTVTFYAPDAAMVPELTHSLQAFAPLLPKSVVQSGLYREPVAPPR